MMNPWILDACLASLHHLAVFALVAVVVGEWLLISAPVPLDAVQLRRVARLDAAYGVLAVGVLVVGALRVVYGAKGWAFYSTNPLFWAKLAVFAAVGLLSMVPTVRLLRWRRQPQLPQRAQWCALRPWLLAELALLAVVPVLAVLMARGFGR
jgi:putative membrane protein